MSDKGTDAKSLAVLRQTAIHEAGHAVAHIRLGIQQGHVTIVPAGDLSGSAVAEGSDHVWNAAAASDQVLAYCAGHAATIAAGLEAAQAELGCGNDFEEAQQLIDFWRLDSDLAAWQARAIALMSQSENVTAVACVAEWLLQEGTLDSELVDVLVEKADGNVSDTDFERFLSWHRANIARDLVHRDQSAA